MKLSKLKSILLLFILTILLLPLVNGTSAVFARETVPKVKESKKTLYTGKENYQITFINLSTKASISYKSDNNKVASVNSKGIVTPLSSGQAIITATIKQNYKTYLSKVTVTVKNPYIYITNKVSGLTTGETYHFEVRAAGIKNPDIEWSVSDKRIALIMADTGILTPKKPGNIKVTAKDLTSGKTSVCYLTITNHEVEFYISNKISEIWCSVNHRFYTEGADSEVTWSVSNPSVAGINQNGELKTLKTGTVTVTAKDNKTNKTSSCEIAIKDINQPVIWSENSFEDSVRRLLGRRTGIITVADTIGITSLVVSSSPDPWDSVPLSTIADLCYFPNLEKLLFKDCYLSEVNSEPLSLLSKLTKLSITYDGELDLTVFEQLKNLTELDISSYNSIDVTKLEGLTDLKKLVFFGATDTLDGLESLENLQELSIHSYNLKDITALAYLKNLNSLSLYSMYGKIEIKDYSPIGKLKKLNVLNFNYSYDDSGLSFLKQLKNLTELSIGAPNLETLDSIGAVTSLKILHLSGDKLLGDLLPLANLSNLTEADLSYCTVTDISPLSNLPKLKTLSLTQNNLDSLGNGAFYGLTNLRIYGNDVKDIEAVRQMKNLTSLIISFNEVLADISPLSECSSLKELVFNGCSALTDLEIVSSIPSLETLTLYSLPVKNIDFVKDLTNLEDFFLSGLSLTKLPDFKNNSKLEQFELGYMDIYDISPIADLKQLTQLTIGDLKTTDLTPLSSLSKLKYLHIGSLPAANLMSFDRLTNLVKLSLFSLKDISDLTPIAPLKNLRRLDIRFMPVGDISPLSNLLNLEELCLGYLQVSDVSALISLPKLRYITTYDTPLKNTDMLDDSVSVY